MHLSEFEWSNNVFTIIYLKTFFLKIFKLLSSIFYFAKNMFSLQYSYPRANFVILGHTQRRKVAVIKVILELMFYYILIKVSGVIIEHF